MTLCLHLMAHHHRMLTSYQFQMSVLVSSLAKVEKQSGFCKCDQAVKFKWPKKKFQGRVCVMSLLKVSQTNLMAQESLSKKLSMSIVESKKIFLR